MYNASKREKLYPMVFFFNMNRQESVNRLTWRNLISQKNTAIKEFISYPFR